MADYQLRRSYSVPQFDRPKIFVTTRNSTSGDLTGHVRGSNKYKPQWSASNYFREPRITFDGNWSVRNQYLSPKYWPGGYLSPLYWPRDNVKHLDYSSEGVPNPYYPGNYNREKNQTGYYRNYFENTYDRNLNDPYFVQDSENRAIARGLEMYRSGLIKYSSLDRYWLTPGYWDRRHRNWQDLYAWENNRSYLPSNLENRTRTYFAY